jgi:hypothetical protein
MKKTRPVRKNGKFTEEEVKMLTPQGTIVADTLKHIGYFFQPIASYFRSTSYVFKRRVEVPPSKQLFDLRHEGRSHTTQLD